MMNRKVKSEDGVILNYSSYGSAKPLIFFVHCWCGDQRFWREQIECFKKDFQVVTIDLAGHGQSKGERDNWTISSFGDDIIAVLNELDFSQLYLVGHSMGGMAALDAASKFNRVNKLIMVDILTEKYWPIPENEARKFISVLEGDFENKAYQWVKDELFIPEMDEDLGEWVASTMAQSSPKMAKEAFYDMLTQDYDHCLEKIREYKTPGFLINSDRTASDIDGLEKMGFKIEIIKGTGHFPMLEKPAEFNKVLRRLLYK